MANICDWEMRIKGKNPENVMKLFKWLSADYLYEVADDKSYQLKYCKYNDENIEHHFYRVGYDGYVEALINYDENNNEALLKAIKETYDREDYYLNCVGTCAWSAKASMLYDNSEVLSYAISLDFATKELGLTVEIYSTEPGMAFAEHYIIDNGNIITEETKKYQEFCVDEFETKEEAEKEYGIKITDEEWITQEGWISKGGFGTWQYEI